MQSALLHSQRNSPSSLPNSLRSSKIRSFTARMSTEWRVVSCWFKVPLRRRGGFLLQCRKLCPRALDNPLQVRQEVSIHRIRARVEGLECLLSSSDQDREQGLLLAVSPRLDPRRVPAYAAAEPSARALTGQQGSHGFGTLYGEDRLICGLQDSFPRCAERRFLNLCPPAHEDFDESGFGLRRRIWRGGCLYPTSFRQTLLRGGRPRLSEARRPPCPACREKNSAPQGKCGRFDLAEGRRRARVRGGPRRSIRMNA
jgi:hypothetical protein